MRARAFLGLLCLAFIAAYFDRVNLSVVMASTEFMRILRLTETERGLLHSAFFWSYCVLQFVAGWIVDRVGAKRSLGHRLRDVERGLGRPGWPRRFTMVLRVPGPAGRGEAVVIPGGMRWIRFNFPEERRGTAIGIYQAAAKIGPALGPPVASWLIPLRLAADVRDDGARLADVAGALDAGARRRPPEGSRASARPAGGSSIPFATVMKSPVIWGTVIATCAVPVLPLLRMTWMPAYLTERRGLSLAIVQPVLGRLVRGHGRGGDPGPGLPRID